MRHLGTLAVLVVAGVAWANVPPPPSKVVSVEATVKLDKEIKGFVLFFDDHSGKLPKQVDLSTEKATAVPFSEPADKFVLRQGVLLLAVPEDLAPKLKTADDWKKRRDWDDDDWDRDDDSRKLAGERRRARPLRACEQRQHLAGMKRALEEFKSQLMDNFVAPAAQGRCGKQDDPASRRDVSHAPSRFDPVHARHPHIAQDNLGSEFAVCERGFAAVVRPALVAVHAQDLHKRVRYDRFVIDDCNSASWCDLAHFVLRRAWGCPRFPLGLRRVHRRACRVSPRPSPFANDAGVEPGDGGGELKTSCHRTS